MALDKTRLGREFDKFGLTADDETAVRVLGFGGSLLAGVSWDSFEVSYPSNTQEIYEFYQGGLAGTLVATVTINYVTAQKEDILNAVRT